MKNVKILFILVLFLFSCSDNVSIDSSNAPGVIIPLNIGNKWAWKYSFYGPSGLLVNSYVDTFSIGRDTIINSEKWFSSKYDRTHLYANRMDGYYNRYKEYNDSISKEVLRWKYPATVNDTTYRLSDTCIVLSTSEDISTVIGNFNCYKYKVLSHFTPDQEYRLIWISKNNGIIKQSYYTRHSNGQVFLSNDVELVYLKINYY